MAPCVPGQTNLRAHQVPRSIRFLRTLGVPAPRLAHIFGESADNLRHIDSRSYAEEEQTTHLPHVNDEDRELLRLSERDRAAQVNRTLQGVRLRPKQDLEHVERSIWAIFANHQSVGLEEGYQALLNMRPGIANARHGDALRVRLLLQEKLAWFAMPLGKISKALDHATEAMRLAVGAFQESAGESGYLLRYGEAALVASICLQKLQRPQQSLTFIRAADEANIAIGRKPGSEHLRQRGVSFTQMGPDFDDRADRQFAHASTRMLRKDEARHEVDIVMVSDRQRAFLNPAWGWGKVQELAKDAKVVYGSQSMQYGVAAKSAALAGLKYATAGSTEAALKLLEDISPALPQNSRGVRHLLSITPDLKLSPDELDLWLRFAANETPLPARK